MGRTLVPATFFGTLAETWAILKAGSESQKSRMLRRVAGGRLKLALAVADENGGYSGSAVTAACEGNGYRLTGAKCYVVDALSADNLVVAATLDGAAKFFVVDRRAEGVEVNRLDWRDITRQVCSVHLKNTVGELLAESNDRVWPWVRDRLYLVLAAESAAGIHAVRPTRWTMPKSASPSGGRSVPSKRSSTNSRRSPGRRSVQRPRCTMPPRR
jgi:alkylation response protein AidB-like acyl-CoA dehydrogenase